MLYPRQRLIIALVGPCGAGKSTLADALAELPGVDVVRELPPKIVESTNDYRDLDVPALQIGFLRMRLEQTERARSNVLVFDRTVDEDCSVFLQLHHELGGLNDRELARLKQANKRIGKLIGSPGATVVLRADEKILRQRIANGARPAWLEESFDRQLELYSTFIEGIKGAVLEVDTTYRSPISLRLLAHWIVETAWIATSGTQTCDNYELGLHWEWREP